MISAEAAADAYMDPWCVVPLIGGDRLLFGFAVRHPGTGGLSWVRSTPIRHLDEAAACAITASGRRYALGRRIEPEDVPLEGEEAWLAFDLLIGPDAADDAAVPPISADGSPDAEWITACKIARHLSVAAPDRAPARVDEFMRRHIAAYLALRAQGRRH